MRWLFTQQAFAKAWFLPCFTVSAHQARIVVYENYAFKRASSEILSLNFTAMELSYDIIRPFLVWRPSRPDNETVIGNGRLHMLESSGTQFVRGLLLFLLARRVEIMKCHFKPCPNWVANRSKLRALRAEAWHARRIRWPVWSFYASLFPVSVFWQNANLHTY